MSRRRRNKTDERRAIKKLPISEERGTVIQFSGIKIADNTP